MALVTLTDRYSNLNDWPGNLLSASDGVAIGTRSATNFSYTYDAGTRFAGYTVTSTGTGFAYDGTTPIGGTMSGLTIRDTGGNLVLSVTGIVAGSLASDLSLFASYEFGWSDPGGGGTGAQNKNAWSQLLSGNDTYTGTAGDDNRGMVGVDAGNDVFNMRAGDDVVNGGMGNDTINGGDGWDGLTYSETHWNEGIPMVRGITVNAAAGTVLDPYGFADRFTGLEWITGSAFGDVFNGAASAGMNFAGLRGADTIKGASDRDWALYGDDAWFGGKRGIVADLATGTSGTDILGTIRDGFGNTDQTINLQSVAGTRYNDTFVGSGQNNVFAGGEGRDSFSGGAGVDQITFNWWFSDAPQHGIIVNLKLATGQIVDDGFGNRENAVSIEDIYGSSNADRITATTNANWIEAREGDDTMTGGGGVDHFSWRFRSEIGGNDVITDFNAGAGPDRDILQLGVGNWGASTILNLVNGTAATAAVSTFIFNAATDVLSWDADGTGAGAAFDIVTLNGVAALTAANFVLD